MFDGDIVAGGGGSWDNGPEDHADIYIEADKPHGDFEGMMKTPIPNDGRTPQDIINGKTKTMDELLDDIFRDDRSGYYEP